MSAVQLGVFLCGKALCLACIPVYMSVFMTLGIWGLLNSSRKVISSLHCSASRKRRSFSSPAGVVAFVAGFFSSSSFLTAVEKIGDSATYLFGNNTSFSFSPSASAILSAVSLITVPPFPSVLSVFMFPPDLRVSRRRVPYSSVATSRKR